MTNLIITRRLLKQRLAATISSSSLFGLIPNCATWVVLAELYLKQILSFGSVIAGLSVSGGLGILVLFKEEKNKLNVLKIVLWLFGIGVSSGIIIQYFLK